MSMNEHEIMNVFDIVQRHLNHHQPTDYHLDIMPQGIQRDGDWWYVTVLPDKDNVRSSDYYARLQDTEEDIERDEDIKVLLVPSTAN
jgi:hypothetical protein